MPACALSRGARGLVQDDLIFAVTIQVGDRCVAGPVVGNRLDGNLKVVVFPGSHRS